MTTAVFARPPFREDWTGLESNGEYEDAVMSICVSALLVAEWEVVIEEEGALIPYEEYDHD